MKKSSKENKPIGERTGLIIFLSLIFAPVGLYLVWKYKKEWPKFVKIALSVVASLMFVAACFGAAAEDDNQADAGDQMQQEVVERGVTENQQEEAQEAQQEETQEVQDKSFGQTEQENQQEIVLITNTGKKYHKYACTEGDYFEVTLEEAVKMGLTPCKNCY